MGAQQNALTSNRNPEDTYSGAQGVINVPLLSTSDPGRRMVTAGNGQKRTDHKTRRNQTNVYAGVYPIDTEENNHTEEPVMARRGVLERARPSRREQKIDDYT